MIDLRRWEPFTNMEELHERINRLFHESMGRTQAGESTGRAWAPLVDVYEDQDGILMRADLAGVSRDEVEIEVTGDMLTISGERKPFDETGRDVLRMERPSGAFRRSFNIGIPVNQSEMKASLKDGILEIRIPKAEETKPKRIQVEGA